MVPFPYSTHLNAYPNVFLSIVTTSLRQIAKNMFHCGSAAMELSTSCLSHAWKHDSRRLCTDYSCVCCFTQKLDTSADSFRISTERPKWKSEFHFYNVKPIIFLGAFAICVHCTLMQHFDAFHDRAARNLHFLSQH